MILREQDLHHRCIGSCECSTQEDCSHGHLASPDWRECPKPQASVSDSVRFFKEEPAAWVKIIKHRDTCYVDNRQCLTSRRCEIG